MKCHDPAAKLSDSVLTSLMDPAEIAARVRTERFMQFMRRERMMSLSGALPSAYLVWLLWDHVPGRSLLQWWLALLLADLVNFVHAHWALARRPEADRLARWRTRQFLSHGVAGVVWGLAFQWVGLSPSATIAVVVVVVAVYAIAVSHMQVYPAGAIVFTLAIWTWPMLRLLGDSDPLLARMGLGLVVLALSMNFFVWEAAHELRLAIERRLQSDALSEALREAAQRIHRLASEDELTGCMSRREGLSRLARLLGAAASPAAVLMLDIDHFKRINDCHGHPAGDAVLREVAARLRAQLRQGDVLARLGGEEFMVALPCADDAAGIAERLRSAVAAQPVTIDGGAIGVTLSIGWVAAQRGDSSEAAIGHADAALYRAKHAGRNRVVAHADLAGASAG